MKRPLRDNKKTRRPLFVPDLGIVHGGNKEPKYTTLALGEEDGGELA